MPMILITSHLMPSTLVGLQLPSSNENSNLEYLEKWRWGKAIITIAINSIHGHFFFHVLPSSLPPSCSAFLHTLHYILFIFFISSECFPPSELLYHLSRSALLYSVCLCPLRKTIISTITK